MRIVGRNLLADGETMKCFTCGKKIESDEVEWIADGEFDFGLPHCKECASKAPKTVRNGKSSTGRC